MTSVTAQSHPLMVVMVSRLAKSQQLLVCIKWSAG